MYLDKMTGALEAVLFAAGEPVSVAELAGLLQMEKPQVWELVSELKQSYEAESRGLMLREIAGCFQLVTKPVYYSILLGLGRKKEVKLTNASLETSALKDIEHGIYEADLGLTPQNDGEIIRITVPALTEERRKEFAKNVWKFAEHAKVAVRNIRRDANDEIKKCDGSEDEIKDGQNRVQKLTDKFVKEIDEIGKAKEKDIMTV